MADSIEINGEVSLNPPPNIEGVVETIIPHSGQIEIRNNGEYIQWKYVEDDEWRNIVAISELVGPAGQNGQNGTNGVDGADGKSAYQIWLEAGNVGTESDFLASLVGPQGVQGIQGPAGQDGQDGATGPQGPQGEQGPAGQNGQNGTNGVDGADGKSAYQIWLEAGHVGTESDFLASLVGPQGVQGIQGPAGQDGQDGATGPQGPQGEQGPAGQNGEQGPQGVPGPSDHDFTFSTLANNTTSFTFPANQRCYQRVTMTAGATLTFSIANKADNYVRVYNSSASDITLAVGTITFNGTAISASSVVVPDDTISVKAGKYVEIGIVVNEDGAEITVSHKSKSNA